jgi:hypothetical protein
MTSLISVRRAAEDFARVVDGSRADVADRYADLTAYVDLLRAQDTPEARPEFVADLRMQLMTAADTLLVPAERTARATAPVVIRPRRRERRLAVAAAAFVIVGGSAGVAAAAENALPGDPLYPIKRGIESAQVSLNSSDAAKGRDLISQASTRLDEIDGLMSDGNATSQITHTLSSFRRSASNGADLLFVAYQRNGDVNDLARLRGIFSEQQAQLAKLAGQAPPTAQPDFAAAAALLADLDQQARVLCGNCGPGNTGDFADLSSGPVLESLISQPAQAAAADALKTQAQQLAHKADEVAKNTPLPSNSVDGSTTRGGSLPGVSVPSLPTTTNPLGGTVKTVTGGVQGLLDEVGTSTGLTPLTDTVNNTVDALTGLLLGP